VYYFGGGFQAGDGSESRRDRESMARKGIVAITIGYRLGVFGFLAPQPFKTLRGLRYYAHMHVFALLAIASEYTWWIPGAVGIAVRCFFAVLCAAQKTAEVKF
jgi:hypothetical protein